MCKPGTEFNKAYFLALLSVLALFGIASFNVLAQQATEPNADLKQILLRIKQKQQAAIQAAEQPETTANLPATSPNENDKVITADSALNSQMFDVSAMPLDEPLTAINATSVVATHVTQGHVAPGSRFAPGEELILSLSVNKLPISEIFALKTNKYFLMGLGDFFQLVEYPIHVDLEQQSAEGWFLKETNKFKLSLGRDGLLYVSVNDQQYLVQNEDFQFTGDDLFIEAELLQTWFGFTLEVDEARLTVNMSSESKFPVEARLARQQRYIPASGGIGHSVMPHKDSPYQLFSSPLIDVQVSSRHTKTDTNASYSILGNLDLAFVNTEFFLSGNDYDMLSEGRLTASRQSKKADLLGPLKATEIAVGDVTPVNAGFGGTLQQSRGVYLTNTPINQIADNRRVNLTGELQVGWDVELYRNGLLLDRRLSVSDGRYEFNDVELAFGENDFELVFYGPQGQIETKNETFYVDGNTVGAGQSNYRVSLVDANKSLLGINDQTYSAETGLLFGAVYDYGLTDWLSLTTGMSWFKPDGGEDQQFYSLNANISLGQYGLLSTGMSADIDEKTTFNANYRTRWLDTTWSFNYRYNELLATELQTAGSHTSSYSVVMEGKINFEQLPTLNYQNSWVKTQAANGEYTQIFENAVGINGQLGSLTHNLIWNKNAVSDKAQYAFDNELDDLLSSNYETTRLIESDSLVGGLQYRKNFGGLFTRLFSSYVIKPEPEMLSYGAAFNYSWTPDITSDLRLTYFIPNDQYQLNLGLNWKKDAFLFNTSFNYNERDEWVLGLSARFSLGYEPLQGSMFSSGRAISRSGAAVVRVFEDLNMNGIFDEGEPLIENATVKAVQSYREASTNEDGVAVLTSLFNNVTTDIIVDEKSLDGPFMITAIPGVAITARKGYLEKLDLPVVKAGELDGVIYLKNDEGEMLPAPYIMLNLVDDKGEVVASARSEYDGMYLFNDVKPGKYTLKIDDAYIDRRGLKKVRNKQIKFSSDGDVIVGVDFTLAPLEDAEGFVVSAGQFNSAGMLKVYYHMLRKRLAGVPLQKPFYIRSKTDGKYVLGLAYFESADSSEQQAQKEAERLCAELSAMQIRCQAEYHGFKY